MKFNYAQQRNVSGGVPKFGAIFMSNSSTKKECFEKNLFGLPSFYADFVRKVKRGMVLFLFEFEQRKLYGVFQAASDGAMNIIPHAYCTSGKEFPAQVLFSTIWDCHPLDEHDFHDAIKDNYFSTYKFNFGLSKSQVHSLLWLFNSRKIRVPNNHRLFDKSENKRSLYKSSDEVHSLVFSHEHPEDKEHSTPEKQHKSSPAVLHKSPHNSSSPMSIGDPNGSSRTPESSCCTLEFLPSKAESAPTVIEPKAFINSSDDLSMAIGDFIPLPPSSPENSDSSEAAYEESQAYIPLPVPKLSDLPKDGSAESDEVSIPLSFLEQSVSLGVRLAENNLRDSVTLGGGNQMKINSHSSQSGSMLYQKRGGPVDHKNDLQCRGLYSDNSYGRTSVFSRLKSNSKNFKRESINSNEMVLAVDDIMNDLERSLGKWEKTVKKAHTISRKSDCNALHKRKSVFDRLASASNATYSEKEACVITDIPVSRRMQQREPTCRPQRKTSQEHLLDVSSHKLRENLDIVLEGTSDDIIPASTWNLKTWHSGSQVEGSQAFNYKCGNEVLKMQYEANVGSLVERSEACEPEKRRKLSISENLTKFSDIQTTTCDEQLLSRDNDPEKEDGEWESPKEMGRTDEGNNELPGDDLVMIPVHPINCESHSREAGQSSKEELKLGEPSGGSGCCVANTVTELMEAYEHGSPFSSAHVVDKNAIAEKEKVESSEVSIGTHKDKELGEKVEPSGNIMGIESGVRQGAKFDMIEC